MTIPHSLRATLALALLLASAGGIHAQTPRTEYDDATALGLELRRLGTTKRVLMIGAHPDDERTDVLTTLGLGGGAEVAYLSLTRGEGGQNAIGPELQEGLGLVRSQELMAARRVDGARQYFGRAIDFGFSKNAEEAYRHWPHEEVLADVVATIRDFRPDVVVAVFSGTPADGHGQHQVSGIVAREGFTAAADPARFPEQVAAGLRPFQPARLYQSARGYIASGGPAGGGGGGAAGEGPTGRLEAGEHDALLGGSYAQIAALSRSRHRSQGFGGATAAAGPRPVALRLAAGDSTAPGTGVFAGVDTTFTARLDAAGGPAGRARELLAGYEQSMARLRLLVDPPRAALVTELARGLRTLHEVDSLVAAAGRADLRERLATERAEAETALWLAQGLTLDAIADDETVVPGQQLGIELSLHNAGASPVGLRSLEPRLPAGWAATTADPLPATLAPGAVVTRRFNVSVSDDAVPTEPYFLRTPRTGDMYVWPEGVRVGIPFEPAPIRGAAEVAVEGTAVAREAETVLRPVSAAAPRRPVRVVPPVSVLVEPDIIALPLGAGATDRPLPLVVTLRADGPREIVGTLRLELPAGWRASPEAVPLNLVPGEPREIRLSAIPTSDASAGEARIAARFESPAGTHASGYTLVDYPHIQPVPLYEPADVRVRAFEARVPEGLRVGYVPGSGDDAALALRQLGVEVTDLDEEALATGELGGYDAILVGIRAYEVRPDTVNAGLARNHPRLLEYARDGGTLVVQYFRYENAPQETPVVPYGLVARLQDRITDEAAPVRLLEPDHPALSHPNRIGAADFEGWVQERGLYFPAEWDARFTPLLEMADPGEAPQRGGLLVAPLGEGIYVYTGLALFRQFPEGVPGAYRLLANLVSLGADR